MKTTVELADDVVTEAKRYANRHGNTLRDVIEGGIRATPRAGAGSASAVHLRDASVGGSGLQPEFRDETWSKMREAAYEGNSLVG